MANNNGKKVESGKSGKSIVDKSLKRTTEVRKPPSPDNKNK